jgi:hypothetical protein
MPDQYYSASATAKLYIGTSTTTPLPAPGADTFTEVPLVGTITPPPKEQSAASFYILNDNNPRSVGGRAQEKIVESNLVIDRSEAVHNLISADADVAGGRKRNWRIVYPDGHILNFKGFVTRWIESQLDASQDATPHRADFTIRVDGAVTES